jgi:large subunit ribosomal protein L6
MAETGLHNDEIEVPDKVQVTLGEDGTVKVKGPLGEMSRKLYSPKVRIVMNGKAVVVSVRTSRAKHRALMKIVYAHFPIKASVKGDVFLIENFLGEKAPRKAAILGKTKVTVKGDQVLLSGVNIEEVGQTAANIEKATKIKGFDPRIFQDGIYITEKAGR